MDIHIQIPNWALIWLRYAIIVALSVIVGGVGMIALLNLLFRRYWRPPW